MKRIIVPLDFSKEALHGLDLAIKVANLTDSYIEMVYVQKKKEEVSTGLVEEEHKWAEKKLKHTILDFKHKIKDPENIGFIIKKGIVYKEVVNQAQAFEDSLIISSTHGASGFEEFFMGSNTLKIITATDRPVITIRGDRIPNTFDNIVLPVDVTNDSRQKVPPTIKLAKAFNSVIHIASVLTTEDDDVIKKVKSYAAQVIEYCDKYEIEYKLATLKGNNIADLIIEYSLSVHADLISIMTEQSIDINNFVMGSYPQQILNKSSVPVLCITPKDLFKVWGFRTQG